MTKEERKAKAKENWSKSRIKKALKTGFIVFASGMTIMLIIVIIAAVNDNSKPTAKAGAKPTPKPKPKVVYTAKLDPSDWRANLHQIALKNETDGVKFDETYDYIEKYQIDGNIPVFRQQMQDLFAPIGDVKTELNAPLETKLNDFFIARMIWTGTEGEQSIKAHKFMCELWKQHTTDPKDLAMINDLENN